MYHIHFSGIKGKLTRNIHLIGLFILFYFYQIRHLNSDSSKVFLIKWQWNFIITEYFIITELLQLIWLASQRRPVNIKQLSTFFSFIEERLKMLLMDSETVSYDILLTSANCMKTIQNIS